MPKKWVPARTYGRMPHAEEPPPSLWWYRRNPADDELTPESRCVIEKYLHRASRGRTLPDDFEKKLAEWLWDLSCEQQISPRKKKYWTIPAYAKSKRLHAYTLCKRLRELENVAKDLFPHRVPASRQPVIITEEKKKEIRDRFLQGEDIKHIAEEFRIAPARVGQICKTEKAIRRAEREAAQDAVWQSRKQAAEGKEETNTDYIDPALSDHLF